MGVTGEAPHSEFSVKAYSKIARLVELTPQIGHVNEGEYVYFDYYNTCEECEVIITANVFDFSRDIDLYVNQGAKAGLPTEDNYLFKSDLW